MHKMTLGQRIAKLMHERDLTQEGLGELADVPRRTVQNLIYDKVQNPQSDTIVKIAKALGVSSDALMGSEPEVASASTKRADLIIRLTSRLGTLDERELGALDSMVDSFLSLRATRNESAG